MGGKPAVTLKAIVFDLDGTLIDSAPDLRAAANQVLASEGRRPLSLDEIKAMVGDGAQKLMERAFAATGAPIDGAELVALTRRYVAVQEELGADLTRPFPGAVEALVHLKREGRALGICTNKPQRPTQRVLGDLGLASFFAAVVGGDVLDGVRKPDPRHLLATVEALGARPADAVMVGDNENDVGAARAAGVPVIAVAFGYAKVPPERLGADALIESFAELPAALGRLP